MSIVLNDKCRHSLMSQLNEAIIWCRFDKLLRKMSINSTILRSNKKFLTNDTIKIRNAFYYLKRNFFFKIFPTWDYRCVPLLFLYIKNIVKIFFTNVFHVSNSFLNLYDSTVPWEWYSWFGYASRCYRIVHSRSFPLMLLLRGSKRRSAALLKEKLCDLDSITRKDHA